MSGETVTGGCLCGAIHYQASHRLSGGFICHCRMCQRATGSAFLVSALYPRKHFQLTQGEPLWYASSKVADRGFCGACGSQLFNRYSTPEWSGWIGVSLGSHDDPNAVPAECHVGVESQQAWLELDDDLPKHEVPDSFLEDPAAGNRDAYAAIPQTVE